MCFDPLTAGFMAAQAAVSLAGTAAAQEAKQQEALATRQRYNQNVVNALAASRDQQRALTARTLQEQAAKDQKIRLGNIKFAEKRSEVLVNSAAAGVSGLSVDNLVADLGRKTAENRAVIETNWQNTVTQLQSEADGINARAESRINSLSPGREVNPAAANVEALGTIVKAGASIYKEM